MTNIKIIIMTHGNLGREFHNTVQDIMGSSDDIEIFDVYRSESIDSIKENLDSLLNRLLEDNAVLILTDMIGGTPSNISIKYLKNSMVEVLTGVNLPVVITALNKRKSVDSVQKLAEIVTEAGKKSIVNCRIMMNAL